MSRIENNIREPLLEGGGTGGRGPNGSDSEEDKSVDLSQFSNQSISNSDDSHDRNHSDENAKIEQRIEDLRKSQDDIDKTVQYLVVILFFVSLIQYLFLLQLNPYSPDDVDNLDVQQD